MTFDTIHLKITPAQRYSVRESLSCGLELSVHENLKQIITEDNAQKNALVVRWTKRTVQYTGRSIRFFATSLLRPRIQLEIESILLQSVRDDHTRAASSRSVIDLPRHRPTQGRRADART